MKVGSIVAPNFVPIRLSPGIKLHWGFCNSIFWNGMHSFSLLCVGFHGRESVTIQRSSNNALTILVVIAIDFRENPENSNQTPNDL
jgi:hypothetical protein